MFKELKNITQKSVSKRELQKASRLIIEELPEQAETAVGLVEAYSEVASHDLPLATLQRLPAEVSALDPKGLHALARRDLQRSVDDEAERTVLPVSTKEHHRTVKVRIL